MIVDILKHRGIKDKSKGKKKVKESEFDANFCTINLVVEDIHAANEGIESIIEFKRMFKSSNDPSEADRLYKQCQEENKKTDRHVKAAKKLLQQEKKELDGKYPCFFV